MSALLKISVPTHIKAPGGPPPASLMYFLLLIMAIMVLLRHFSMTGRREKSSSQPKVATPQMEVLPTQDVDILDRNEATAVFLIGGRNDLGPLLLRAFAEQHAEAYRQVLFVAVGVVDASAVNPNLRDWEGFHRTADAKRLRNLTRLALDPYLAVAHRLGLKSDCRIEVATDPASAIGQLALGIARKYSRTMFFVGKLVFEHARWYHRVLHSGTADSIRQCLERKGIPVTVIPVVMDAKAHHGVERN
jgi:hypothetical protein